MCVEAGGECCDEKNVVLVWFNLFVVHICPYLVYFGRNLVKASCFVVGEFFDGTVHLFVGDFSVALFLSCSEGDSLFNHFQYPSLFGLVLLAKRFVENSSMTLFLSSCPFVAQGSQPHCVSAEGLSYFPGKFVWFAGKRISVLAF